VPSKTSKRQASPTSALKGEGSVESQTEGSNVFELLDSAVIAVLGPNFDLAANVIGRLYRLPAGVRSLVYGFVAHGNNESGSYNSPLPNAKDGTDSQGRAFSSTPSSVGKRKVNEEDDGDDKDRKQRGTRNRDRTHSKAKVQKLKYACPFNIMDPARYCVRNEIGGTGELYRSCMGTGWGELLALL
jgi:hypothetical protein